MTREELISVQVPRDTESYSAVSHRSIIEVMQEELDKHNLVPVSEEYNTNKKGTQVIGYMDIARADNQELGMRLAFRNSYDKSMSVAFTAGSVVWICGNGMVRGELQYLRRHTGNVNQELHEKIIGTINQLDQHFEIMLSHSEAMKNVSLSKDDMAQLLGRMFFQENLITPTQLSIVKQEFEEPQFEVFRENNLWSLYNYITYSLKTAHPLTYIQEHKNLHEFVEREFQL